MGFYTAIFGKVTIKKDVTKAIDMCNTDGVNWKKLLKVRRLRKHPDVINFIKSKRFDSITSSGSAINIFWLLEKITYDFFCEGRQVISYVDDIKKLLSDYEGDRIFEYCSYKRELIFFSSHKNYDKEIEKLFIIAPLLFDDFSLYSCNEDGFIKTCSNKKSKEGL